MDREHLKVKAAQKRLLRVFSAKAARFALAGGTALEFYYLNHRFSADLDFFSPKYDKKEIKAITEEFKKYCGVRVILENEFISPSRARTRFYSAHFKDLETPIKIDFIEDVLFDTPDINKFNEVRVYSVESIYLQKITAIAGTRVQEDEVGRQFMQGRGEARDVFDIYMLSKNTRPLHIFLEGLPDQMQMGVVNWYQTFSRHDVKIGLLGLDIYDKKFDARKMVIYLESEIKKFMKKIAG